MCCGYPERKSYWTMKRFNFSEPLSSWHLFHFRINSSHTPLHGWGDPNLTGFLGEHWEGVSRVKLQGHTPKADKYFPQYWVHWGKEEKTTAAFVSLTLCLLCILDNHMHAITAQQEPAWLAKAKVWPQSKSDFCRDEGGLGKMYFNFSSDQC